MAWSMFKHALFLVFNNLGNAFKASFVPMVIMGASWFLWASTIGIENFMSMSLDIDIYSETPQAFFRYYILLIIVSVFCSAWTAVTWHRFILLGENISFIPSMKVKHILIYVIKSILIALIVILPGVVLIMIVTSGSIGGISELVFVGKFTLTDIVAIAFIYIATMFIIVVFMLWLWFRLALVLPATAIGNVYGIRKSWSASKEHSGTIFKLGLIIAFISALIQAVTFLFSNTPLLGFALTLFISWINMIVGITLLTTLYGHIVEGRELMVKS